MRFFSLVDFQYMVLALFMGLLGVVLVYVAWGSYPAHREDTSEEDVARMEGHEIEEGHKAKRVPIAPFLIFIYIGIAVWSICYMIFTGIHGVSF
jgi:hypothetical protein